MTTMERITFGYSTKNIPLARKDSYIKTLIEKTETLIKNMRWRAFFYINKNAIPRKKPTFGFKSGKTPPAIEEMRLFENKMTGLIQNIQFLEYTNDFQKELKKDLKASTSNSDIIVKADKTSNFYKLKPEEYSKLLDKNIQKSYKKATEDQVQTINKDALEIAQNLELEDRIETLAKRNSFITLKDHKENFMNNPSCRLINPTKSEIGKISKQILEKIVSNTVKATNVNLWRNTKAVLEWFSSTQNKTKASFISFDIVDFYPSISENLLAKAIEHAEQFQTISDQDKTIIMHAKQTLLFSNDEPWRKKDNNNSLFDVPMGSYDGAETCEIVVCYLLHQIKEEFGNELSVGLYRDDGLAISHGAPREIENQKKAICKIFEANNLKITIEANKKITDHLDVTLDLNTQEYRPYMKPGNRPQYVHAKSNHPPNIIKAIPEGINKRLSEISSSEKIFKETVQPYQTALQESGHRYQLKYEERSSSTETDNNNQRKRKRNITWFNPPFDRQVKTNIGKAFFKIVNDCFPNEHILHKIFNRNTLKISYSCMPNIKDHIDAHNKRQMKKEQTQENECNCRRKDNCPVDGKCLQASIVYQASVIASNQTTATYIGLSETSFKTRYNNHKQSFNKENLKNVTELSKHIWKLKQDKIEHRIKWTIVGKARAYNNRTKKCNLCNLEKFFIIYRSEMATLNKKSELVSTCRHKRKFLLI